MKDGEKKAMNFQQAIEDTRANIMKNLIDTGVFSKLTTAMTDLTQFIAGDEFQGKIKTTIQSVSDWVQGLVGDWSKLDAGELWDKYIVSPLEGIGIKIPTWVSSLIFGPSQNKEVEEQKVKLKDLRAIRDELVAAGVDTNTMADGTIVKLSEVEKEISEMEKSIAAKESGKSWFEKLYDNIGLLGTAVLGTLAVGGTVYVALAAFGALLALFGIGKIALGAALLVGIFVGTGYAIKLAGDGINSAGEGVERVSKALEEMSKIKDTANLKTVAGVLGEMSTALMKFAVGGAIAKLMDKDTLPNLAESLKSFESVNASALAKVGPGIAALYEGTSKFTGDGAWEGFSKWVGSLFGGDNNFEQMAEGIKNFEGIDGTKLANLGEGLGGIAEFVNSINAASDLDKQVKAVRQLVKVMEDYTKQYNKMSGDMQSSFNMAVNNSGKETVEALNELNTVIKQLVYEQQESNKIGNKIVGAVNEGGAIG